MWIHEIRTISKFFRSITQLKHSLLPFSNFFTPDQMLSNVKKYISRMISDEFTYMYFTEENITD